MGLLQFRLLRAVVPLFYNQVMNVSSLAKKLKYLTRAISVVLVMILIGELVQFALGSPDSYFNVPRVHPGWDTFFDLRIFTLNGSNCNISYADITSSNHCASRLYSFNYPKYYLYVLKLIPLHGDPTLVVGIILGIITILVTAALFNLYQPSFLLICLQALSVMSFGFRWSLERGQLDQVMYLLALSPAFLPFLYKAKTSTVQLDYSPKITIFASITFGLANLLKLFTATSTILLAVLDFHLIFAHNVSRRYRIASILAISIIAFSLFLAALVFRTSASSLYDPLLIGSSAYGLSVLTNHGIYSYFLKALPFAVGSSIPRFSIPGICNPGLTTRPPSKILPSSIFILAFFSIINVSLYLLAVNLNYKLLFLVPISCALTGLWQLRVLVDFSRSRLIFILFLLLSTMYYPYRLVPQQYPAVYQCLELYMHYFIHPMLFGALASVAFNGFKALWLGVVSHHIGQQGSSQSRI